MLLFGLEVSLFLVTATNSVSYYEKFHLHIITHKIILFADCCSQPSIPLLVNWHWCRVPCLCCAGNTTDRWAAMCPRQARTQGTSLLGENWCTDPVTGGTHSPPWTFKDQDGCLQLLGYQPCHYKFHWGSVCTKVPSEDQWWSGTKHSTRWHSDLCFFQ